MLLNIDEYDIGVSFSGKDRKNVKEVVSLLRSHNLSVFYDENHTFSNLRDELPNIYAHKVKYFSIIFMSKNYQADYISNQNNYTDMERKVIQSTGMKKEDFIIYARFDDTNIDGYIDTEYTYDLREMSPKDFVQKVIDRINKKNFQKVKKTTNKEDTSFLSTIPKYYYIILIALIIIYFIISTIIENNNEEINKNVESNDNQNIYIKDSNNVEVKKEIIHGDKILGNKILNSNRKFEIEMKRTLTSEYINKVEFYKDKECSKDKKYIMDITKEKKYILFLKIEEEGYKDLYMKHRRYGCVKLEIETDDTSPSFNCTIDCTKEINKIDYEDECKIYHDKAVCNKEK